VLNNEQTPDSRTFVSAFSSQKSSSTNSLSQEVPALHQFTNTITFPVSAIALEEHPRVSTWAGLAEGGQILDEAEAQKGAPFTLTDLRALYETHLDVYSPNWAFGQRGITDEWMDGFSRAFMLAAQQAERAHYPEPLSGIGTLVSKSILSTEPTIVASPAYSNELQPVQVRFRQTTLAVHDFEAFQEGVWQGQIAGIDEGGQMMGSYNRDSNSTFGLSDAAASTVMSVKFFDEVLDVVAEIGNLRMDYVVGYLLSYSDALLSGRQWYPTKGQTGVHLV